MDSLFISVAAESNKEGRKACMLCEDQAWGPESCSSSAVGWPSFGFSISKLLTPALGHLTQYQLYSKIGTAAYLPALLLFLSFKLVHNLPRKRIYQIHWNPKNTQRTPILPFSRFYVEKIFCKHISIRDIRKKKKKRYFHCPFWTMSVIVFLFQHTYINFFKLRYH